MGMETGQWGTELTAVPRPLCGSNMPCSYALPLDPHRAPHTLPRPYPRGGWCQLHFSVEFIYSKSQQVSDRGEMERRSDPGHPEKL